MTSVLGIPATYVISYYDAWYIVFVEGEELGWFNTKQEAEQAAREHYQGVI